LIGFHDHASTRKAAIKTLWIREMAANGVLVNASHNICFAHDDADVAAVTAAYDSALGRIAEELARGELEARLECGVVEPVFSVREGNAPARAPS
jgi:hypothetical protein